jgi:hypothetical protein
MNRVTVLFVPLGVAVISAIGAPAASAYTVTGGPSFRATTGSSAIISNNDTGAALTCSGSVGSGTVSVGPGVGPVLGTMTAFGVSGVCTGWLGTSFAVVADGLPYSLVGTGPAVGDRFVVTPTAITGVNIRMSGQHCALNLVGALPGNYNNATRRLTLTTAQPDGYRLTASNVNGCFGLMNNGDTVSITTQLNVVGSPSNPIAIND